MRCQQLFAAVAAVALVWTAATPTSGQTAAQDERERLWTAPRTSDGQPDLQGVWLSNNATPLQRPPALADRAFLTDEEVARLRDRARRIFENGRSAFAIPESAFFAALNDVETYEAQSTSSSIGMVEPRIRQSYITCRRPSGWADSPSDGRSASPGGGGRCRVGTQDRARGPQQLSPMRHDRCSETGRELWHGTVHLLPADTNSRLRRDRHGSLSRRSNHSAGRASSDPGPDPPVEWRFTRALGRRHAGGRDGEFFSRELFSRRGRQLEAGRAVHAHGRRHPHLSVDVHRPDYLGHLVDRGDASEAQRWSGLRVCLPRGESLACRHAADGASARETIAGRRLRGGPLLESRSPSRQNAPFGEQPRPAGFAHARSRLPISAHCAGVFAPGAGPNWPGRCAGCAPSARFRVGVHRAASRDSEAVLRGDAGPPPDRGRSPPPTKGSTDPD